MVRNVSPAAAAIWGKLWRFSIVVAMRSNTLRIRGLGWDGRPPNPPSVGPARRGAFRNIDAASNRAEGPNRRAISCRTSSIAPAALPQVSHLPSAAIGSTEACTLGKVCVNSSSNCQCRVARRPSRYPAEASSHGPVSAAMTVRAFWAMANARRVVGCPASFRKRSPPATIRRSHPLACDSGQSGASASPLEDRTGASCGVRMLHVISAPCSSRTTRRGSNRQARTIFENASNKRMLIRRGCEVFGRICSMFGTIGDLAAHGDGAS